MGRSRATKNGKPISIYKANELVTGNSPISVRKDTLGNYSIITYKI